MRVCLLFVLVQCSALSFGKVSKLADPEAREGRREAGTDHGPAVLVDGSAEGESSADGSAVLW